MKVSQTLKKWFAVTMVGVMTFLALIQLHPLNDIVVLADETKATTGAYADSELTSVLPSAYYDARNQSTADKATLSEKQDNLKSNVNEIISDNFGNVGLFLGPATEVDNQYTAFNANPSVDTNGTSDFFTSGDLKGYYQFGNAIHKLSASGSNTDSSVIGFEKSLDTLSHSMSTLTKLGVRLMKDYDPSPLLFSLYLTEGNTQKTKWMNIPKHVNLNSSPYSENKLVRIVQDNALLRDGLALLRRPPFGKGNMTLISWVVFGSVILLIMSGTVMKAVNGRAAGENYRKALVRIVIGTIGVPIVAMVLHYGVNTFSDVVQPELTQDEVFAEEEIGKHLNLADWYATGFAIPAGQSVRIEDGRFKFTQSNIRSINNYTFTMVTQGTTADPDTATPNPVAVLNRLRSVGAGDNRHEVVFSERSGWDGVHVKVIGNTIKENKEKLGYLDVSTSGGNYLVSRNVGSVQDGVTTIFAEPGASGSGAGEHNFYGVSPLAAHNMMRSSFSSGVITANSNKPSPMTGVVHHVITEEMGSGINPVVRFLATIGMITAAIKALATIFATGFGGIIGGAASSSVGKTSGMGQALGGVFALVGGVIGMGIIMNLSFILLDEMGAILFDMFVGVTGDASMIEPFREAIDAMPKWLGFLKGPLIGILNSFAAFASFLVTLIVVPKFGKIPITMFGEKMAELPSIFAERAQMMENRFTGDYRGGAGGGSSMGRSLNNQVSNIGKESMSQLAGVGAATAALSGMGASAIGGSMADKADSILEGDDHDYESISENDEENVNDSVNEQNANQNEEFLASQELAENEEYATNVDGNVEGAGDNTLTSEDELKKQEDAKGAADAKGADSMSNKETVGVSDTKSTLEGGDTETSSLDETAGETITGDDQVAEVSGLAAEDSDFVTTESTSVESGGLNQEIQGDQVDSEVAGGLGSEVGLDGQPTTEPNLKVDNTSQTNQEGKEESHVKTDEKTNAHAHNDQMNTMNQHEQSQLDSDSFSTTSNIDQPSGQGAGGQGSENPSGAGVSSGISSGSPSGTSAGGNKSVSSPGGSKKSTGGKSQSKPNVDKSATGIPVKKTVDSSVGTGTGKGLGDSGGQGLKNSTKDTPKSTSDKPVSRPVPSRLKMSSAKMMKHIGRGLQSAGGEVSAERGAKAVNLAASSVFRGGKTQERAQRDLDKAQGRTPLESDQGSAQKQESQPQQNRRAQRERNERIIEEEERNREYEKSRS